jgi:hypothetical protein
MHQRLTTFSTEYRVKNTERETNCQLGAVAALSGGGGDGGGRSVRGSTRVRVYGTVQCKYFYSLFCCFIFTSLVP